MNAPAGSARFAAAGQDIAALGEPLNESEGAVGNLTPPFVDREGVPAVRELNEFGDGLVSALLLVLRLGDRRWNGVVAPPETISSGPRSGFFVSTFASVYGFRFAVAAWKSGTPDPGTAKVS